jgi:hypothetical protein
MGFEVWEGGFSQTPSLDIYELIVKIVRLWILHMLLRVRSIYGGKEDAGSGEYFPVSWGILVLICFLRDVAAGICILREAGGLITTANPPPNPETDPIEEVRLGSRLYLAIRPAGDSENETGRQAQERVVRETWKRVNSLDYSRPGA